MSPTFYLETPGFLPIYPLVILAGLVVAYLCGAIPVALVVGKLTAGIDIREHGSGNTGTTNALRTLGWGPGIVVFIGDMLKGVLGCLIMFVLIAVAYDLLLHALMLHLQAVAVLPGDLGLDSPGGSGSSAASDLLLAFAPGTLGSDFQTGPLHDIPCALALLATMLGHMFSPFMRFKGGKGIATGLGALLVTMPPVALFALSGFIIVVLLTRIVSAGSLVAAVAAPIGVLLFYPQSATYLVLGILITVVVIYAHKKNIVRLIHREEPRFSVGKKPASEPAPNVAPTAPPSPSLTNKED
jgi:glycerol-3-phosphate acyltransferase PlsY